MRVSKGQGRPRAAPQPGQVVSAEHEDARRSATLPAARRRGVWHALVAARCTATPDLPAVAFTSDYSRPGFVRTGLLPITRFTLWAVAT
jgi:hypothetical protein